MLRSLIEKLIVARPEYEFEDECLNDKGKGFKECLNWILSQGDNKL